jgi:hypothetical protein
MELFYLTLWFAIFSTPLRAAEAGYEYSEADFQTLVKTITPEVFELTDSTVMYNWHPEKSDAGLKPSSRDPDAFADAQKFMKRYWDHQLDPKNAGMGDGLYLALDPVITRSYGRGSNQWVLTEVRLPKGFRILDAHRQGHSPMSKEQLELMNRLGCTMDEHDDPLAKELVNPKNNNKSPSCAAVIRRLLNETLKVDALAYGYDSTYFSECDATNPHRQTALVVMNGEKISSADIRIFNRTTNDDLDSRIRIQSLIAKARLAREEPAPATLKTDAGGALLWHDLEGKPYDSGVSEWIRKNTFACGREPKIMPIQTPGKTDSRNEADLELNDSIEAPAQ